MKRASVRYSAGEMVFYRSLFWLACIAALTRRSKVSVLLIVAAGMAAALLRSALAIADIKVSLKQS